MEYLSLFHLTQYIFLYHCISFNFFFISATGSPQWLDEWGCSASSPWILHPTHSTQVRTHYDYDAVLPAYLPACLSACLPLHPTFI